MTESGAQVLEAELTVGFLAFKESYASTVTCVPNESVKVRPVLLVNGLLLNLLRSGRRVIVYPAIQRAIHNLAFRACTPVPPEGQRYSGVLGSHLCVFQPIAC